MGTPKTAGLGGRRWLARFWGTLARTTAGATLLPFCALPCYSISKTKIFVFSTAASHYRLDNGKWLEPDRAFATSLRLADNQGSLRGSGRSGEAGAACTPSRWVTVNLEAPPISEQRMCQGTVGHLLNHSESRQA